MPPLLLLTRSFPTSTPRPYLRQSSHHRRSPSLRHNYSLVFLTTSPPRPSPARPIATCLLKTVHHPLLCSSLTTMAITRIITLLPKRRQRRVSCQHLRPIRCYLSAGYALSPRCLARCARLSQSVTTRASVIGTSNRKILSVATRSSWSLWPRERLTLDPRRRGRSL